jgi:hypothetical protein
MKILNHSLMAKKQPIKKQIPVLQKCGDCSHGKFLDHLANMDLNGNPICLKCPFKEFNVGRFEKACVNFKKK